MALGVRRPRIYVAVYLSSADSGWPLDDGDDPSFAASERFRATGGVLTWGVCRRDVRNALIPGDLVVFFAADRLQERRPRPARYFFVGFATVDRKIAQSNIWTTHQLTTFRRYHNLLIRPAGSGFEHFEPGLPRARWHGDWFWRMTRERRREKVARLDGKSRLQLREVAPMIAANYILFAADGAGTMILASPPVIATSTAPGPPEKWKETPFARELRAWLRAHTTRSLRTTNVQRAHRHITIRDSDPGQWRDQLRQVCKVHGLKERSSGSRGGGTSRPADSPMGRRRRGC
jgi:hypothetical protein